MTMLAPEAESSIGLTSGQKASAGLGAVPTAKTNHPYVVGIVLVLIGGFGLIGSLTGTLPSMIAALFVPSALTDSADNSPGIFGQIGNAATGILTDPLKAVTGGAL